MSSGQRRYPGQHGEGPASLGVLLVPDVALREVAQDRGGAAEGQAREQGEDDDEGSPAPAAEPGGVASWATESVGSPCSLSASSWSSLASSLARSSPVAGDSSMRLPRSFSCDFRLLFDRLAAHRDGFGGECVRQVHRF